MMYTQDYDETLPSSFMGNGAAGTAVGIDQSVGPAYTWQYSILPYTKSDGIYTCPSNRFSSKDNQKPIFYGTPRVSAPLHYVPNRQVIGQMILDGLSPLSAIDAPSESVMVAENKSKYSDCNWTAVYSALSSTSVMLNFTTNQPETVVAGEGFLQAHQGMSNFVFADGHVKAMKPQNTIYPSDLWNCTNSTTPGLACPAATRQTRAGQVPAEYK